MQAEDERWRRAKGLMPRASAHQARRWRIRLLCGHLQLSARFLPDAQQMNRLMTLVVVMLLVSGMLMALDAPRTLGLYLLLLAGLEGLVVMAWGVLLALQWWHAWCSRHPPTPRVRRRANQTGRTGAFAWASRRRGGWGRSELDWRLFEAAWLFLLLLWWGVHS